MSREYDLEKGLAEVATKTAQWWQDAIEPESDMIYEIFSGDALICLERLKRIFFEEREALKNVMVDFSDYLIERLYDLLPESSQIERGVLEREKKVSKIADQQMRIWYYSKLKEIIEEYALEKLPDELGESTGYNSSKNY